jgi:hypothetical protein
MAVSSKPFLQKQPSTNILDYPSNMSMYEKDSLASEARLAAEKKAKKRKRGSGSAATRKPV